MIFFILESMMINKIQASLEAITTECTFDFIVSKKTDNFSTIINRHLEGSQKNHVSWSFVVYEDLATMCSSKSTSKGGEDVILYQNNAEVSRIRFLNKNTSHNNSLTISNVAKPETSFSAGNSDAKLRNLRGKAFMLTFVYDYNFSSAFVQKLFAGGHNTLDGKKFLLWARGFGVCN